MSTAVAKPDQHGPREMVKQYETSFAAVLPSHIAKPETWVRLAQGALKKGKRRDDGRTDLEVAAGNNPGAFLAALLDCARLGLEPGTEQYYLTPRKGKGGLEVLGIVGYQGIVELMFRAGYITSVVAECVYSGDTFSFSPGRDEVPHHEIDWVSPDRGRLTLVYAFARMRGGGTSKVVVLNSSDIARVKESSDGAGSSYSPWQKHEAAMWLKSAVRNLSKWVPTSAEIRDLTTTPVPAVLTSVQLDNPEAPPDPYAADDDVSDAEIVRCDRCGEDEHSGPCQPEEAA